MELWIRSQDENSLIKANNIYSDVLPEDGYYKIFNMPDEDILGKYITKKRALEVLDDIQNFITIEIHENNIDYEQGDLILKGKIVDSLCKIYQMPKE